MSNNMNNRIWIKALDEWRKSDLGGSYGLTIPFLVGMQTQPKYRAGEKYTASDILKYIFDNTNKEERYGITMCPKLKVPIIGKSAGGDFGILDGELIGDNVEVFIDEQVIRKYGTSKEEIIAGLIADFSIPISEGTFSRVNLKWGDYDEQEKKFIESII